MVRIDAAPIPAALIRLLKSCLSARSEFTPMGLQPFESILDGADVDRALSELIQA